MFFSGVDALWRDAPVPVLVVHGEDDFDSVPASMVRAARGEGVGGGVTFDRRPGLGHDLLRADVFGSVDAWIRARERAVPREALISPALFSPCGEKREPAALRLGAVREDEPNPLSQPQG